MEKISFKDTLYNKDKSFLRFMYKYKLNCDYILNDNLNCYSTNQNKAKVLIFVMKTDYPLLFGNEKSFYEAYRILRSDFRKAMGLVKECEFKDICSGILIYPNKLSFNRKRMLKNSKKKTPLGVKIEEITNKSERWLLNLNKNYGVKYLLKTNEGYIIGPEESLLLITDSYLKHFQPKVIFEIGAGTGETSAFILKNTKVDTAYINEKSFYLKKHLINYFKEISKKRVRFIIKDIQKVKIPKTDLLISGVFYGELPFLIKNKGKEIKKALGKKGLFVIQSGMLENMFALTIIEPSLFPKIKEWEWYNPQYNLKNYFNQVTSFFLNGEIITLASQDKEVITKTKESLIKRIALLNLK
jgi:hypothetical protein